ncbi:MULTISPECIES: activator-dependent family glycosyltransferase [Micromonospora]|uniref:activator-dependent family glycosyltransferase n=1 Tax=Micromonospora TaxID=1873 RepID=UPI0004C19674|nr:MULTISPECIES: activator-dependent family glycosyltransferase [Micromonospora]
MRVLLTTFAVRSHIYSLVPIAWALRAAGHDVCVATHPEGEEHVVSAGLPFAGVGEPIPSVGEQDTGGDVESGAAQDGGGTFGWADWPELLDLAETDPTTLTYDYLLGVFAAYTPMVFRYYTDGMVDGLVEFARRWKPDLVLWDTMSFAGPVAAAACGAAHARVLFGLDILGHARGAFLRAAARRPASACDDPLREWLDGVLRRHGRTFSEEVVVGQWTVDPVVSSLSLGTASPRIGMRYVPYNGPSVVPAWLAELDPEVPRVCVTMGISHREIWGADRVPVARLLDGIADLGVEVVATLSGGQRDGVDTERVRVVDFAPLDALLPLCSAVVSHGGAGSFQTALVHGVPQVLVPDMLWDTGLKASRLEQLGAGLRVREVPATSALVERALTDRRLRDRAARLRREALGMPAPREVVPVLERLTARHGVR